MTTIESPGPKLSVSDIGDFEKRIGATMPEVYRQFLLGFNGGLPSPDVADVIGLTGGAADVQVFFGINRTIESSCLEWNLTTLSQRLPKGLLPIATDSGGSVFCLSLRKEDFGTVSYCDLQSVFADYDAIPRFYPVADDFETFLQKLRPFE